MNTICAYCGAPDPTGVSLTAKDSRVGDLYACQACRKLCVQTESGLRKSTRAEQDDAARDWRSDRAWIPTMIGFDARG